MIDNDAEQGPVADQQADLDSSMMSDTNGGGAGAQLVMLREKLAICHDLSKHVWLDNQKRNFRLLQEIHKHSEPE